MPICRVSQGWATILVLVTQRLALQRELHVQQKYTSIHDKSTSWLGLGSSLLTLVKQDGTTSSTFWGVMLIVAYLSCIFVIHITTPNLFEVATFNSTQSTVISIRMGRPLTIGG